MSKLIPTASELSLLAAIRAVIAEQHSTTIIGTVEDTVTETPQSTGETTSKNDAEAAALDVAKGAELTDDATPEAEPEEIRPYQMKPGQRKTKVEMMLAKVIADEADEKTISAAQVAVDTSTVKKLKKHQKTLKDMVDFPTDLAASQVAKEIETIDAEIAKLNDNIVANSNDSTVDSASENAAPPPPSAATSKPPVPAPAAPAQLKPFVRKIAIDEMTEKAAGATYEQFLENGWSREAMINDGYMTFTVEEVTVDVTDHEIGDEAISKKLSELIVKAGTEELINELNAIVASYGDTVSVVPLDKRDEMLAELIAATE